MNKIKEIVTGVFYLTLFGLFCTAVVMSFMSELGWRW